MKRLLDFARQRTDPPTTTTFAEIGFLLGASSATLTNWKSRGLSKEGALVAERLLGCSAHWLLTGEVAVGARRPDGEEDVLTALTELLQEIRQLPAGRRLAAIAAARAAVAAAASAG